MSSVLKTGILSDLRNKVAALHFRRDGVSGNNYQQKSQLTTVKVISNTRAVSKQRHQIRCLRLQNYRNRWRVIGMYVLPTSLLCERFLQFRWSLLLYSAVAQLCSVEDAERVWLQSADLGRHSATWVGISVKLMSLIGGCPQNTYWFTGSIECQRCF